jgi:hypothetical protein
MKTPHNKNYMSIGVSVRTTKFSARNNGIGIRQESNPLPPTAYSSVRYKQAMKNLTITKIKHYEQRDKN